MKPLLWIAIWLSTVAAAQARTPWPDYIGSLRPEVSSSAVTAEWPADLAVVPPDAPLPAERRRWSGRWQGWACAGMACDVKVAVERVDAERAIVFYAGASASSAVTHRGEADFVDDELHMRVHTGAKLVLRLRADGDMELSIWRPDTQLLSAGVLTQRPLVAPWRRNAESLPTPWTHEGQAVSLAVLVYRPQEGNGPWPTLVVNHGSTGNGDRPAVFGVPVVSMELVRHFTQRGWQVLFPQRRGRGGSGGLYDEGFLPDRSRYSCDPRDSLPGFERAQEDLHHVMQHVATRPDVDARRVLLAGVSRGGILASAYAGQHPQSVVGVINFVGGWMSDRCQHVEQINPVLFRRAAAYPRPMLWLYGSRDPFYALRHSRSNFDAFRTAGGRGRFVEYDMPAGQNGHLIAGRPDLWRADVDAYLREAVGP
jgi:pimeloyl-ACP methyl ester carboxylesterase